MISAPHVWATCSRTGDGQLRVLIERGPDVASADHLAGVGAIAEAALALLIHYGAGRGELAAAVERIRPQPEGIDAPPGAAPPR